MRLLRGCSRHGTALCATIAAVWGFVPEMQAQAAPVPHAAAARAAAQAWWVAFVRGDTAYVRERSAPGLLLTLSNGRTYDHAAMTVLGRVQLGRTIRMQWLDSAVLHAGGTHMVTTHRVTETGQGAPQTYRYLTVLEARRGSWRVVAAQSTREMAAAPRVGPGVSGALTDYAGSYRGARGGLLRIVSSENSLTMIEPGGASQSLVPIGPGLFELDFTAAGGGVVQFVFARGATGRVASLSRVGIGVVTTWSRVE